MALSNLRKEFSVAVASGEPAIRVDTDELDDAIRTIGEECKKHGWEMRLWDRVAGVQWVIEPEKAARARKARRAVPDTSNPMAALNSAAEAAQGSDGIKVLQEFWEEDAYKDDGAAGETRPVLIVMKNFHLIFERGREQGVALIQHIVGDKVQDLKGYANLRKEFEAAGIPSDSETGKFIVGLCVPDAKLPPEISPLFKRISHDPPDEEELSTILDGVILPQDANDEEDDQQTAPRLPPISADTRRLVCKYALGLTRSQATGVFSSAVLQFGRSDDFESSLPRYVWQAKSEILNKEGLVALYTGEETFEDVVGQTGLKQLLEGLLTPDEFEPDNPKFRSKGLALVGPPRTGKSLTSKAAGNQFGLPTLMVDVGAWFGGIVGDTERNTRRGFQIIRAHAPCIAVIDEVEKVMPSSRGGGGDSGVSKRMAGTFMTNLQEIKEHVFWVFTANDTEELHEAFLADDRVDAVVYVHMPGPLQLAAGWQMFLQEYFPKTFGDTDEPFKLFLNTDFSQVLEEYQKTKKPNLAVWANRFVAALLCVPKGPERDAALKQVLTAGDQQTIAAAVEEAMFDDDGWTLARIKSVCRMARKMRKPLSTIAQTMPRKQTKLAKAIERLEAWADGEAIDAETGLAYTRATTTEEGVEIRPTKKDIGKVRRTVRTQV